MAHDVFISYSSKDKTMADAVCATLEAKGIRCWVAPRDLTPSTPYAQALVEAIKESQLMVLVFSANSNTSTHVMREVERAVSRGIPIIPFRVEDVPLSPNMEYFLSAPHWLDALTPPLEAHLVRLSETISLILASKREPATTSSERSAVASSDKVKTSSGWEKDFLKRAIVPGVGLALILAATFWVGWFLYQRSNRQSNANNANNANSANPAPSRPEVSYAEDYNIATSKLGSTNMQERLDAIHILDRIAQESDKEYWTVMNILTAYVRNNAPWKGGKDRAAEAMPLDIQEILHAISRRTPIYLTEEDKKTKSLDLSDTDLRGLSLKGGAHLERSDLKNAHLESAALPEIHLEDAVLKDAYLVGATLYGAYLKGTDLNGTDLDNADLQNARGLDPGIIALSLNWECAKYSGDFLQQARAEIGEDIQCK